jgi:hypothetical protein
MKKNAHPPESKKKIPALNFYGWLGPHSVSRTCRVPNDTAEFLDAIADNLGTSRALIDSVGLQWAASMVMRYRNPGEAFKGTLDRLAQELHVAQSKQGVRKIFGEV